MIISVQSVYCNFVLKIILFFVSGKLEKILGAGHAQQEIFVVKSAVVRTCITRSEVFLTFSTLCTFGVASEFLSSPIPHV